MVEVGGGTLYISTHFSYKDKERRVYAVWRY